MSLVRVQLGEPVKERRYAKAYLLFFTLFVVGREQPGDCISGVTTSLYVATNNLNGCWLGRGRLLRRVQLGEPEQTYPNLSPIGDRFGFVFYI